VRVSITSVFRDHLPFLLWVNLEGVGTGLRCLVKSQNRNRRAAAQLLWQVLWHVLVATQYCQSFYFLGCGDRSL